MPVTNTRFNLAPSNYYNAKQAEKVDALSPKAKRLPTWVKPVGLTALAVAGLAALYFAGPAIFTSPSPGPNPGSTPIPTPTPTPTPTQTPTPTPTPTPAATQPFAEITSDEAVEAMARYLLEAKYLHDVMSFSFEGFFTIRNASIRLNVDDTKILVYSAVDKLLKEKRIVGWSWSGSVIHIKQYANDPDPVGNGLFPVGKLDSHSPFSEEGMRFFTPTESPRERCHNLKPTIEEINKQIQAEREKQSQTSTSQSSTTGSKTSGSADSSATSQPTGTANQATKPSPIPTPTSKTTAPTPTPTPKPTPNSPAPIPTPAPKKGTSVPAPTPTSDQPSYSLRGIQIVTGRSSTPVRYRVKETETNAVFGDFIAMAELEEAWRTRNVYSPEEEQARIRDDFKINFYGKADHHEHLDKYNEMISLAKQGDQNAMETLAYCWSNLRRNMVQGEDRDSIRDAYYKAHGVSNYLELKQNATKGDTEAMETLRSHWNKAIFSHPDIDKSDITYAYYIANQRKAFDGDPKALKLIVSAWARGKFFDPHNTDRYVLGQHYKHNYEKGKEEARNGDLLAMLGLYNFWGGRSPDYAASIRTEFESSFSKLYATLKQKTMSGDPTALDELKLIWWSCNRLAPYSSKKDSNPCASFSMSDKDQASIRDAYNSARVPNYMELRDKALKREEAAADILYANWKNGTIEVSMKDRLFEIFQYRQDE